MRIDKIKVENEIARQALTFKELADIAGITEKTLKAARDGKEIRTATAGRIAAALGVNVEDLFY